jgi:hypothetical protein
MTRAPARLSAAMSRSCLLVYAKGFTQPVIDEPSIR